MKEGSIIALQKNWKGASKGLNTIYTMGDGEEDDETGPLLLCGGDVDFFEDEKNDGQGEY